MLTETIQIQKQKLKIIEKGFDRIFVAGDLHGDFESYRKIKEIWGKEKNSLLIFLGDYADRGDKGYEIIEDLMELKNEENVILLKGNHEDYSEEGLPHFYPCTLINEVRKKFGDWREYFSTKLKPFIESLNLAAVLKNYLLFVHGGISSKINSMEDLNNPTREIEIDVLWSDPYEGYEDLNPRGAGVLFGPEISERICKILNVKRIVRSHQPTKALEKPWEEHGGRVITTSSTRVYGGKPFLLCFEKENFEKYKVIYL